MKIDNVMRDRAVMQALLANKDGDRDTVELTLADLDENAQWMEREDPELSSLLVRAARIHATVDLETEVELIRLSEAGDRVDEVAKLSRVLSSADVVHPMLVRRMSTDMAGLESSSKMGRWQPIEVPHDLAELDRFQSALDNGREEGYEGPEMSLLRSGEEQIDTGESSYSSRGIEDEVILSKGRKLAEAGWKRWRLVGTSLFLNNAVDIVSSRPRGNRMVMALWGTLALFGDIGDGLISLEVYGKPLRDVITRNMTPQGYIPAPVERIERAINIIRPLSVDPYAGSALRYFEKIIAERKSKSPDTTPVAISSGAIEELSNIGAMGLGLHLLSPSPLEVLAERVLGLPEGRALEESKFRW